MADLIDRDALLADIAASVVFSGRQSRNAEIVGANKVIGRIKAAPTVGAVEVGRNKSLWKNKTECTDEALCAVRDYMVQELLGGIGYEKATSSGYEWTLKDGRFVELRVTIKDGDGNG